MSLLQRLNRVDAGYGLGAGEDFITFDHADEMRNAHAANALQEDGMVAKRDKSGNLLGYNTNPYDHEAIDIAVKMREHMQREPYWRLLVSLAGWMGTEVMRLVDDANVRSATLNDTNLGKVVEAERARIMVGSAEKERQKDEIEKRRAELTARMAVLRANEARFAALESDYAAAVDFAAPLENGEVASVGALYFIAMQHFVVREWADLLKGSSFLTKETRDRIVGDYDLYFGPETGVTWAYDAQFDLKGLRDACAAGAHSPSRDATYAFVTAVDDYLFTRDELLSTDSVLVTPRKLAFHPVPVGGAPAPPAPGPASPWSVDTKAPVRTSAYALMVNTVCAMDLADDLVPEILRPLLVVARNNTSHKGEMFVTMEQRQAVEAQIPQADSSPVPTGQVNIVYDEFLRILNKFHYRGGGVGGRGQANLRGRSHSYYIDGMSAIYKQFRVTDNAIAPPEINMPKLRFFPKSSFNYVKNGPLDSIYDPLIVRVEEYDRRMKARFTDATKSAYHTRTMDGWSLVDYAQILGQRQAPTKKIPFEDATRKFFYTWLTDFLISRIAPGATIGMLSANPRSRTLQQQVRLLLLVFMAAEIDQPSVSNVGGHPNTNDTVYVNLQYNNFNSDANKAKWVALDFTVADMEAAWGDLSIAVTPVTKPLIQALLEPKPTDAIDHPFLYLLSLYPDACATPAFMPAYRTVLETAFNVTTHPQVHYCKDAAIQGDVEFKIPVDVVFYVAVALMPLLVAPVVATSVYLMHYYGLARYDEAEELKHIITELAHARVLDVEKALRDEGYTDVNLRIAKAEYLLQSTERAMDIATLVSTPPTTLRTTPEGQASIETWMTQVQRDGANPFLERLPRSRLSSYILLLQRVRAEHVVATRIELPLLQAQYNTMDAAVDAALQEIARLAEGKKRTPGQLLQEAGQLYIPRASWEMQPAFTGMALLHNAVVTGLDEAMRVMRDHLPALQHVTLDMIAESNPESGFLGVFTECAAKFISLASLDFVKTFTKDVQFTRSNTVRKNAFEALRPYAIAVRYDAGRDATEIRVTNRKRGLTYASWAEGKNLAPPATTTTIAAAGTWAGGRSGIILL